LMAPLIGETRHCYSPLPPAWCFADDCAAGIIVSDKGHRSWHVAASQSSVQVGAWPQHQNEATTSKPRVPVLVENVRSPAHVDNKAGAALSRWSASHMQRRRLFPQEDNTGTTASLLREMQQLQKDVQDLREEMHTTSTGPERLPASFFGLPADACQGEEVLITALAKSDPQYELLSRHFMASWREHVLCNGSSVRCPPARVRLLRIEKVHSPKLARAYCSWLKRRLSRQPHVDNGNTQIEELNSAIRVRTFPNLPNLNEVLLYHGCGWDAGRAIAAAGFDAGLAGSECAFGPGVYFTTVASMADFFTDRAGISGQLGHGEPERAMYITRVALGTVHEAKKFSKYTSPPPGCDSILGVPSERGGCVASDEFVVFENSQAMPQYRVIYEHSEGCTCRTCVYLRT